jgi:hypothetical protein
MLGFMRSISKPLDSSLASDAGNNSWQMLNPDVWQTLFNAADHGTAEYGENTCNSRNFGKFLRRRQLQPKTAVGICLAHVVVNDGFRHENTEGDTGNNQTSHNRLLRLSKAMLAFIEITIFSMMG